MKCYLAITVTFFTTCYFAKADLDSRYGHIESSCTDVPITEDIKLSELIETSEKNQGSDKNGDPSPVSVECGFRAIAEHGNTYKMPNGLVVLGELKFEDKSDATKETVVEAPYILVRGHLEAGTVNNPYKSKLRFVLTEFPEDDRTLIVDSLSNNELFSEPMNFGDKAFVVYGGTISLCGPEENKSAYAKLSKSVNLSGAQNMKVKGDWTKYWNNGDYFAITGTRDPAVSHGRGDARDFTASSISKQGKNTQLDFSSEFYISPSHPTDFVKSKSTIKKFNGKDRKITKTAEVYKLSRNIILQGIEVGGDLDAFMSSYDYPRGGHFVIAHTPKKQIIRGVEFAAMGQFEILGRYPIHFHSCGDIDEETILTHNSIHHSKQRCVVVHATNGLTISKNSAFFALDHCFMVEDGPETRNKFIRNIAANVQRSAFWMPHPDNDLIKNVAANSGSAYEYTESQGQFSVDHEIPGCGSSNSGCDLTRFTPMGKFIGNVAHNVGSGIKIYPPRFVYDPEKMDHFKKFFIWHSNIAFDSITNNVVMDKFTVSGTSIGILADSGGNHIVKNSNFHKVCKAIHVSDRNHWNRLHSGIIVKRSVIESTWQRSDHCAPLVFSPFMPNEYVKVSTQFVDVKLYNVDKLFAIEKSLENNIRQYGFFLNNVESLDSDMTIPQSNQPSFVVRHNYSGNQIYEGSDFMVKDCSSSADLGGFPVADEFYFCKGMCWRAVAIMFPRTSGAAAAVAIKFVTKNNSFTVSETPAVTRPCRADDVHIIQVLPADKYEIILIDQNGNEVNDSFTDNVRFYHADQGFNGFDYDQGCQSDVELTFKGGDVPVSDFYECGGYYS